MNACAKTKKVWNVVRVARQCSPAGFLFQDLKCEFYFISIALVDIQVKSNETLHLMGIVKKIIMKAFGISNISVPLGAII